MFFLTNLKTAEFDQLLTSKCMALVTGSYWNNFCIQLLQRVLKMLPTVLIFTLQWNVTTVIGIGISPEGRD